jgi:hypothetical protein
MIAFAQSRDDFRIVELLLDLGFSPTFVDPTGELVPPSTSLFDAARNY